MDGWRYASQFEDSMEVFFVSKHKKKESRFKLTILFEFHLYGQPEPSIFSSEDVACSFVLSPSTRKQ